jgi:hypothetical protein
VSWLSSVVSSHGLADVSTHVRVVDDACLVGSA